MGRDIVVAVGVAILSGSGIAGTRQTDQPTHRAAQAALRYFESVQDADFDAFLRQIRRPAPSPAVRAMLIRNLPIEGELSPTAAESAELAAIRPLLNDHTVLKGRNSTRVEPRERVQRAPTWPVGSRFSIT